jgi:hypothetical protein
MTTYPLQIGNRWSKQQNRRPKICGSILGTGKNFSPKHLDRLWDPVIPYSMVWGPFSRKNSGRGPKTDHSPIHLCGVYMDQFGSIYELNYLPMQFFSAVQQHISGLDRRTFGILDHKTLYTHTPGRTPLDARRKRPLPPQQTKEKSIHIPSGIQTRNSCN